MILKTLSQLLIRIWILLDFLLVRFARQYSFLASFPLAIFFVQSEVFPLYLSNLLQMLAVGSSETKVKCRFAQKLLLVENWLYCSFFSFAERCSPFAHSWWLLFPIYFIVSMMSGQLTALLLFLIWTRWFGLLPSWWPLGCKKYWQFLYNFPYPLSVYSYV